MLIYGMITELCGVIRGLIMKDILLDDIFQISSALVILGVCSMFLLPADIAEKILIAVSSGLAGIAKGKGNI